MKTIPRLALAAASLLIGVGAAQAAPSPVGQWRVTFFLEPNLTTGATQNICFKADQTWYSSTFPGWKGYWYQDGIRLRWNGSAGVSATGAFGQFDSPTLQSGEAGAWLATSGAATAPGATYSMSFTKRACDAPAARRQASGDGPMK